MYSQFVKWMQQSGILIRIEEQMAVLVGYSGGADSTLLLHWMHRYCQEKGVALYAAHVHHGIRGEDADRDEAHCSQTAHAMGIPFFSARADIPALAKEYGIGLEECARNERYRFFDKVCSDLGLPSMPVATAHNADDQLETVLFHMMRGSGLRGMTGIHPIREGRYIRPLLWMTGAEIREICRKEGYTWVEDATNDDTEYTRNYIRHVMVPAMTPVCADVQKSVFRMTALLTRDDEYLEEQTDVVCQGLAGPVYARNVLAALHPAIGTRVLRQLYKRVAEEKEMSGQQTEALWNMILNRDDGETRILSLPGGIRAAVTRDIVSFDSEITEKQKGSADAPAKWPEISIPKDGETESLPWMEWKLVLCRGILPECTEKHENIYKLSIQQSINFDKIKGLMRLRTRLPGDTIRYGGMTRKIKKLLCDMHVPVEDRNRLPVLADDEGVIWMAGLPVSDRVRSDSTEKEKNWLLLYKAERDLEKHGMEEQNGA